MSKIRLSASKGRAKRTAKELPNRTIIDVIKDFQGGVGMSAARVGIADEKTIIRFLEEVSGYWSTWTPPTVPRYTVYSREGLRLKDHYGYPEVQVLMTAALFHSAVAFPDPLESVTADSKGALQPNFGGKIIGGLGDLVNQPKGIPYANVGSDEFQRGLRGILSAYEAVAELIQDGTLIPVPSWLLTLKAKETIFSSIQFDFDNPEIIRILDATPLLPVSEIQYSGGFVLKGMGVDATSALHSKVASPSYFAGRQLAIASEIGARFLPLSPDEFAFARAKATSPLEPAKIAHAPDVLRMNWMTTAVLPDFPRLEANTLVNLRKDSDAIAAFRDGVTELVAQTDSLKCVTSNDEAAELFSDRMHNKIEAVQNLQKSRSLASALSGNKLDLAIAGLESAASLAAAADAASRAASAAPIAGEVIKTTIKGITGTLDDEQRAISQIFLSQPGRLPSGR